MQIPKPALTAQSGAGRPRSGMALCLFAACTILAGCASTQGPSAESPIRRQTASTGFEGADPIRDLLLSRDVQIARSVRPTPDSNDPDANPLASAALGYLGIRYRWGGRSPEEGFDCSGLITYAAEQSLGLKLPRSSYELASEGESVSKHDLQVGDLVFFNTLGRRFSHVGIYLGNNEFVHSPRAGSVVRIESMDISYWRKRYNGARRLTASAS
ncbi:MAG: C40 family peptidase [Corticimicrobacter sp.]|uniref:C40 family peptidase n=1 Tax=Corticimicrobacter sp. TaxID=2678536 RepID=UPI0032D9C19D